MSALRRSEDLLSLKTRRIVIQNEDSSYPPAGAVLAMDSTGRGGTVLTQDLSLNSVTLMGQTTAGTLTYSDVSGLLVNSMPIGSSSTLTNLVVTGTSILGISAEVMGPLTANSVNTPYASVSNLDVSNASIDTLTVSLIEAGTVDVSNVSIDTLTATNGSISSLDVSNANIDILDVSAASIHSLDISAAMIINLDASSALISMLDASNATVDTLTATNGSINSLDASNGVITYLDVSAASISSLDASNGVITYLDVSAATFNKLDASSASVSGKIIAGNVQIGENPDPGGNNVFLYAQTADVFAAHIRGPYDPSGTLTLGANATNLSNIVLNADGTTTIALPLIVSSTIPRYYYSDQVAYPKSPWLRLYSLGQISVITGQIAYDNPPGFYYYENFNSFIQNFSLIQVNLYFDAAGQYDNTGVATFKLRSNPDPFPAATKSFFINTSGYPPEPTQVSLSFIMQKGINYDNNTRDFICTLNSLENNEATYLLVGLDTKFKTFHWELIGLL